MREISIKNDENKMMTDPLFNELIVILDRSVGTLWLNPPQTPCRCRLCSCSLGSQVLVRPRQSALRARACADRALSPRYVPAIVSPPSAGRAAELGNHGHTRVLEGGRRDEPVLACTLLALEHASALLDRARATGESMDTHRDKVQSESRSCFLLEPRRGPHDLPSASTNRLVAPPSFPASFLPISCRFPAEHF